MTGSIDLSIEQFDAINELVDSEYEAEISRVIRLVIDPAADKAVRVNYAVIRWPDLAEGYRYVMRDGEILTGSEYEQLTGITPNEHRSIYD